MNGKMKVLKAVDIPNLIGSKIKTKYFGYRGQNGEDEFVVGEVKRKEWIPRYEPFVDELYTADGRNTYIRHHHCLGNDFFSCSDSDREVYYEVIE